MIPLLHDSENIDRTYGRGKLSGVISCKIHEVLNGEYELELRYPVTGPMYGELLKGGTVQCMGASVGDLFDKRAEWFDIYKHSLPIDGVVTFYASHISRRFNRRVTLGPIYSNHANYIINQSYPSGDFGTVKLGFQTYGNLPADASKQIEPKSALSALIGDEDSLISLYGGDITFFCGFAATGVSPYYECDCTCRWDTAGRGSDKGAQVRYGYNMTNIDHTMDDGETFNAVVPYWEDGNGTRTYVSGYIVQPTTPITPIKAVPMDCTDAFNSQPTGAQLATYAQNWLDANMPWIGEETLTVDFANGIEFDPHSPQFDLGDTVHVYWGDAQVAAELRIVEYEFDVLGETFTKLKLGKKQSNFVAVTGIAGGSGGIGGDSGISSPLAVADGGTGAGNVSVAQKNLHLNNITRLATNGTNSYTATKPSWATACFIIRTQGSNYVTVAVKQGSTTLFTFTNDMTARSYYAYNLTGNLTFAATDQYSNNGHQYLLIWS